jgi:Guanylate-binding protein, N-terminal domain
VLVINLILFTPTIVFLMPLLCRGMGAAGATAEHDSRIFSLATLLCSVLLYNSVGAIDEEAVQSLAFIANLTRHIQMKSGSGAGESAVIDGAALEDAASEESGSDPDSDEEDDDGGGDSDDDSPLRSKSKGGVGAGVKKDGSDYILELKRAARKKRAAAKRAQALRLREEARRAAGVSRKGALITAASSAVLGSAAAADNATGTDSPLDLGISGGSAANSVGFPADKKKGGKGGKGAGASGSHGSGTGAGAAISGAGIDEREVSAFFPTFLWLLRDFSLDLRDDDGSILSPREYLEACLQPQEGFSSDVQARNRTRRVLTAFFKERECFTLVRPLDDESQLQHMDSLPDVSLRAGFRRQMQELCSTLVTDVS